jgi:hypothetical protein
MKKQILFTAVIISGILISCSKEKIETSQNGLQSLESMTVANSSAENTGQMSIPPINLGLVGRFEFDANLADKTGNLPNGTLNGAAAASYTTSRNGSGASLYLSGTYGINLKDVPTQTKGSIAVWVKSFNIPDYRAFIGKSGSGIFFAQTVSTYYGGVSIDALGGSAPSIYGIASDYKWHHLAVTYDGSNIRAYGDGILKQTIPFAGSFTQYLATYYLGYSPGVAGFWKGCLDDLRFYNRTISSSEIQSMASL